VVPTKLWKSLFVMIWIVFLEFLIVMSTHVTSFTSIADPLIYVHSALGFGIIALAYSNYKGVRESTIAGRVKRTSQSTFQLSILMAVLGVILLFKGYLTWEIPVLNLSLFYVIVFIHVVNAFAIITQAAAVAIAYDMWEDKELDQATKAGEVPPMPVPAKPAPKP
jgi:hypothetical protein